MQQEIVRLDQYYGEHFNLSKNLKHLGQLVNGLIINRHRLAPDKKVVDSHPMNNGLIRLYLQQPPWLQRDKAEFKETIYPEWDQARKIKHIRNWILETAQAWNMLHEGVKVFGQLAEPGRIEVVTPVRNHTFYL